MKNVCSVNFKTESILYSSNSNKKIFSSSQVGNYPDSENIWKVKPSALNMQSEGNIHTPINCMNGEQQFEKNCFNC